MNDYMAIVFASIISQTLLTREVNAESDRFDVSDVFRGAGYGCCLDKELEDG